MTTDDRSIATPSPLSSLLAVEFTAEGADRAAWMRFNGFGVGLLADQTITLMIAEGQEFDLQVPAGTAHRSYRLVARHGASYEIESRASTRDELIVGVRVSGAEQAQWQPAFEGAPRIADNDEVRVTVDPSWGFHLRDAQLPHEALVMTWAQAQARKLTGVMWCEATEIDQVVIIAGRMVGKASTPYGGDYFIVHRPGEHVVNWSEATTVEDAVDFYRRLREEYAR